jgi:anti-sigma regulatory factor (Ser/Thr protein kinase)
VLTQLDRLTDALGTTALATVWLGVLDPATGELAWCSAGHVPPVLLLPEAAPVWLSDVALPPIGAAGAAGYRTQTGVVPDGARLLLYSDGLVEDRRTQLDSGPDDLLAELTGTAGQTAGALVDAAVRRRTADREDDVVVLALRRVPVSEGPQLRAVDRLSAYPAELRAAAQARRDLRRVLSEAGVPEEPAEALVLAASEAFNNAVEHAQSPSRPEVHVRAVVDSETCRVVVRDFGSWRERPAAMDRGRGSALMAAAGQVRVVPSADGTTVVVEHRWQ